MEFTINDVRKSLAGHLAGKYPDYPAYASQDQQEIKLPCFFILLSSSSITSQIDNRFYYDLGFDIIFAQQQGVDDGYEEIQAVQGFLDESLETFPYRDGNGFEIPIHTYERQASMEDGQLHYKFHIRQRVSLPVTENPMKEMEENNVNIQ